MPRRVSKKHVLMACQMSFDGKGNREIATELGFTETTVSNWRKKPIWQEFEDELVEAYKKEVLSPKKTVTPS